ncbi:MAG TPA: hypothetical protein VMT08_18325 [Bradyrhizobium sp.]|nr:hypothetical protein [Bradyrhizobium sp.]
MRLLVWLAPTSLTYLKPSLDGLEREFNCFNQLEGGLCAMSAPRDQDIPPVSSSFSLN